MKLQSEAYHWLLHSKRSKQASKQTTYSRSMPVSSAQLVANTLVIDTTKSTSTTSTGNTPEQVNNPRTTDQSSTTITISSTTYSTTVHRKPSFADLLKDNTFLPSGCILIERKITSIAFYVLLGATKSPTKPLLVRKYNNNGTRNKTSNATDLSSLDLAKKMEARIFKANTRRATLLEFRRFNLARQWEQIRYTLLIQRQRVKIQSLRRQTKAQYQQSSAQLKRHLILRRNVDRCSARVEYARMISTMQKLKKFVALRKFLTDSITLMLQNPIRLCKDAARSALCINENIMKFSMLNEQEEQNSDDCHDSWSFTTEDQEPSTFPSFSTALKHHRHVNLEILRNTSAVPWTIGTTTTDGVVSNMESRALQPPEDLSQPSFTDTFMADNACSLSSSSRFAASLADLDETTQPSSLISTTNYSQEGLQSFSVSDNSYSKDYCSYNKREALMAHILLDDPEEEYMNRIIDLLPPVTRFTLRELDLDEILTNAQIRHDMYFDPNLQFKPNTDGERGATKLRKAKEYWLEVERGLSSGLWLERIPLLVQEIRAILLELLPYSEGLTDELERVLDVKLIAQQIEHSVFDGGLKLIKYIANLLRVNCAPARDRLVDSMVEACQRGDFAKTLQICFEILELMKLDYANHQLLKLRPYVVEHAVPFEWQWFRTQLEAGTRKLDETVKFLREALERHQLANCREDTSSTPPSITTLLNEGILHLISNAYKLSEIGVPETLHLDTARLVTFFNDWQDITIMGSLLMLFKQAAGSKCTPTNISDIKQQLWILLNDAETSMQHVSLQVVSAAGNIRGKPLTEEESRLICGVVDKTLSPKSTLYELLQKRVGWHLNYYLIHGEVDSESIVKHGLKELKQEVSDLGSRISKVAEFNRTVYGLIYSRLVMEVHNCSIT